MLDLDWLHPEAKEQIVSEFVTWLYDDCPVSPDEVTREVLLDLYDQWQTEGTMATREEILPHTRTAAPDFKDKLLKIVK